MTTTRRRRRRGAPRHGHGSPHRLAHTLTHAPPISRWSMRLTATPLPAPAGARLERWPVSTTPGRLTRPSHCGIRRLPAQSRRWRLAPGVTPNRAQHGYGNRRSGNTPGMARARLWPARRALALACISGGAATLAPPQTPGYARHKLGIRLRTKLGSRLQGAWTLQWHACVFPDPADGALRAPRGCDVPMWMLLCVYEWMAQSRQEGITCYRVRHCAAPNVATSIFGK